MDGTVVDSMPFLTSLGISILASAGLTKVEAKHLYSRTVGRPFHQQCEQWNQWQPNAQINVDKLSALYAAVHEEAAHWFPLTPFAHQLMVLPGDLPKIALISSTSKQIIARMPQIQNLKWDFVGGFNGPGSEKRVQIKDCLEQLGLPLSECVYVGDSPSDADLAGFLHIPFYMVYQAAGDEIVHQIRQDHNLSLRAFG